MSVDENQVEGRLSLLYAISLFGQSAAISRLKHLFQTGLDFDDSKWQTMLDDIVDSDLVKRLNDELILSDNGMVVLSFFQDRIDPETISKLDSITAQNDVLTNYEWQSWYDARHHMLQIMQLKDHQRILGIQLYLSPEEYPDFDELSFSNNEDFIDALKILIQKQKET